MNRINILFEQKKRNILSVYFTAGYPHIDDTRKIVYELQNQGVDMVEIGIPFSDPMADGPVIQAASTRALKNGMSLKRLFRQLSDIRTGIHIPIILMGYLNPIMQYGFENFCRDCSGRGIDGMIIPDLPFQDYLQDYKPVADRYGLRIIMLITPETSEERIRFIDEHTDGFIYMVSSASTTGAQKSFAGEKELYFKRIENMHLRNPRLIGFGISNKETFDTACQNASGGIIGSKFIELLEEKNCTQDAVMQLFEELSDKIKHYEISNFKTWLYSVAKNHCLQLLRRDAREFPTDWNTLVAESGEFLDLLEEEGDEEQLKALHHCLDRLPEEQRVSICEFFLSEKSYAEIAEQTGYVLKSVKSYIQNGKRNLKLCIEKTTKEWGYCPI